MDSGTVRVGVVQASPVYLDRDATIEKVVGKLEEAAGEGAALVAFPEGFVPGHPLWYHFHPATGPSSRDFATRLAKNSVVISGAEIDLVSDAARRLGLHVVLGVCERASDRSGTLYNAQVLVGPDGAILNHHRKLTPTVGERLVHAPGDASGLRVVDTAVGRLSGLICGENSNPLALFTLLAEGTQIHTISWPDLPGRGMLKRGDRAMAVSRAVAFMSKAYVLNAIGVVNDHMRDLLPFVSDDSEYLKDPSLTGGSSIIGPDGNVVAGPLGHEESILYADLDLGRCIHEKLVHDFAGHYNRPDIFTLTVDRTRRSMFKSVDDEVLVTADDEAEPVQLEEALSEP